MGYQIADIVLKDGKIYKQVVIDSGFITRVRGLKNIPFNADEIEDVIITNDKWDFDKE